jgi:NAD-dependent deacetylase
MTRIVVLTGAGLSAESGLGTFRDKGGIWSQYDLAEVATPEGFAADPAKVHAFYNARRANAAGAAPNAAHEALVRLEAAGALIITQNVDDLLTRAGAREVVHMHGQLARALCAACDARWDAPPEMSVADCCPSCGGGPCRPDIVWFGEFPYHMERIADAVQACDLFVAIGTSGQVYPAAGFAQEAAASGAQTLEINLEPSGARFDRVIEGPASETVPAWVAEVTGQ